MSTLSIPRTPESLHASIRELLDIDLSRAARLAGHACHFDYICHTFFSDLFTTDSTAQKSREPLDAVVLAPRGGGKTFLGALSTTLDLVHKPGIQIRIVAGSEDQGSRMLQYLRRFFQRPGLSGMIEGKPGKTAVELSNRSRVEVLAQSHASVRGIRVHKIKCDEVELFDPDIFAAVQLTTLSGMCGDFEVRGTVDCLSTQHLVGGLMQRMVKECEEGSRTLFRWSLVDVLSTCSDKFACHGRGHDGEPVAAGVACAPESRPCALLPECSGRAKEIVPLTRGHLTISDALRMKTRVDQDTWRSEMLCLKPGRSLAVFRDFDRARHVVDQDPPRHSPVRRKHAIICGMDFGFRSPTAILWAVFEELDDGEDRLTIVEEYQQSQRTIEDHINLLNRRGNEQHHVLPGMHQVGTAPCPFRLSPEWIGADPAGNANTGASVLGSHIAQLRRAGFHVKAVRTDLQAGLTCVRQRLFPALGPPTLVIHKRCTQLIEAMQNYHYPAQPSDTESPEKDGSDHLCDALRYMVVNLERGGVSMRRYA